MKTYPHTPAPWKIGSNGASVKVVDAEDKAICMLTPRKEAWNGGLIAAAPEMLAMLQRVVDLLNDPDADAFDANQLEREIEQLITKAAR